MHSPWTLQGGEAWENLSGEELGSLTRQAKKLQLKGNALLREASHQVLLQAEVNHPNSQPCRLVH